VLVRRRGRAFLTSLPVARPLWPLWALSRPSQHLGMACVPPPWMGVAPYPEMGATLISTLAA
jgi:hypothetical protein